MAVRCPRQPSTHCVNGDVIPPSLCCCAYLFPLRGWQSWQKRQQWPKCPQISTCCSERSTPEASASAPMADQQPRLDGGGRSKGPASLALHRRAAGSRVRLGSSTGDGMSPDCCRRYHPRHGPPCTQCEQHMQPQPTRRPLLAPSRSTHVSLVVRRRDLALCPPVPEGACRVGRRKNKRSVGRRESGPSTSETNVGPNLNLQPRRDGQAQPLVWRRSSHSRALGCSHGSGTRAGTAAVATVGVHA